MIRFLVHRRATLLLVTRTLASSSILQPFKQNSYNNNNKNNNNYGGRSSRLLFAALPMFLICAAAASSSDEFKEHATGLPFPRKIDNGNVFIGASGFVSFFFKQQYFRFSVDFVKPSSNCYVFEIQSVCYWPLYASA